MRSTQRLQSKERIESLRIALASGANKKYISELMQFYTKGALSQKSLDKSKPKSVDTGSAFEALKGMM